MPGVAEGPEHLAPSILGNIVTTAELVDQTLRVDQQAKARQLPIDRGLQAAPCTFGQHRLHLRHAVGQLGGRFTPVVDCLPWIDAFSTEPGEHETSLDFKVPESGLQFGQSKFVTLFDDGHAQCNKHIVPDRITLPAQLDRESQQIILGHVASGLRDPVHGQNETVPKAAHVLIERIKTSLQFPDPFLGERPGLLIELRRFPTALRDRFPRIFLQAILHGGHGHLHVDVLLGELSIEAFDGDGQIPTDLGSLVSLHRIDQRHGENVVASLVVAQHQIDDLRTLRIESKPVDQELGIASEELGLQE